MCTRRVATILLLTGLGTLFASTESVAQHVGRRPAAEAREHGFYADRSVLRGRQLLLDPAIDARVTEIGQRVAALAGDSELQFTFRVVNDPSINAFAVSGGFVYVNTGMLDILESEDELAAVLGHEIAHTSRQHPLEFLYEVHTKQQAATIGGIVLGAFLGAATGTAATNDLAWDMWFDLGDLITTSAANAMLKGYGRTQELQADSLGSDFAARAGYDPLALVRVFRRMAQIRDNPAPGARRYESHFMNAQPGLDERIRRREGR